MRYRIDFSYWHYGSGYSHTETFDVFDVNDGTTPTIEDYIEYSDLEWIQFADFCDMIMISLYDDENLISRAYWDEDEIRYDELDEYDAGGKH